MAAKAVKVRTLEDIETDIRSKEAEKTAALADLTSVRANKAQAVADLADDDTANDLAATQTYNRLSVLEDVVPAKIRRLDEEIAALIVEHVQTRLNAGHAAHAENIRLEDEARIEAEKRYAAWKEADVLHTHYGEAVAGWHNEYQRLSRELAEAQAHLEDIRAGRVVAAPAEPSKEYRTVGGVTFEVQNLH